MLFRNTMVAQKGVLNDLATLHTNNSNLWVLEHIQVSAIVWYVVPQTFAAPHTAH